MALVLPSQMGAMGYKNVEYLQTNRPWLSLYGMRVRPVPPAGSTSKKPVLETSLLHQVLPEELLQEVFMRMVPYSLGRAACVCRKWQYATRTPSLWRAACLKTWQAAGHEANERILVERYGGSWRAMWQHRPRLRFDGLYVSRNTYIRAGIAEWKITNPVHLVCYYRYIRFYPNGKFLYKTTPQRLREVAKSMQGRPSNSSAVFGGRCNLTDTKWEVAAASHCHALWWKYHKVDGAILYPGLRPTALRIRLRLRGTVPGSFNRLDLVSLVTCGVDENHISSGSEDTIDMFEGWEEDETRNADVPAISHRRGMAPFVFVPFEEIESSVLNLPVEKMDYYVPG